MSLIANYEKEELYKNLYSSLANELKNFIKTSDLITEKNIVSENYIFAKKKLYVKEYNKNYDCCISGNTILKGDLVVNGNIKLNKDSKIIDDFKKREVSLEYDKELDTGLSVINDKDIYGIYLDGECNSFTLLNKNSRNFINLKLNDLKCNSISSIDNDININGNLRINGNLEFNSEIKVIKDLLINTNLSVNSLHVKDNILIEKTVVCKKSIESNQFSGEIFVGDSLFIQDKIVTPYIQANSMSINNTLNVLGNIFDEEKIFFNTPLIFSSKLKNKIIFKNITNIDNLSCNYINSKKVNVFGDIVTTEGKQILLNKEFLDNVNFNSSRLLNIDDPIDEKDAVNKRYVDNFIFGLQLLKPVIACTTEEIDGKFINNTNRIIGNYNEKLVIDNIELKNNDRILIMNQENNKENGVYKVIFCGDEEQNWIIEFSKDYKTLVNIHAKSSYLIFVKNGEINKDKKFGINLLNEIFEINI